MTNTLVSIFICSAHVESAVVDRLEPDTHQPGRRSSRVWYALCLLQREVLHA